MPRAQNRRMDRRSCSSGVPSGKRRLISSHRPKRDAAEQILGAKIPPRLSGAVSAIRQGVLSIGDDGALAASVCQYWVSKLPTTLKPNERPAQAPPHRRRTSRNRPSPSQDSDSASQSGRTSAHYAECYRARSCGGGTRKAGRRIAQTQIYDLFAFALRVSLGTSSNQSCSAARAPASRSRACVSCLLGNVRTGGDCDDVKESGSRDGRR
jgi:hypothetical protein